MKRIILSLVLSLIIVASVFTLTGCNYNVLDTNWNFKYAYISFQDGTVKEVELKSWTEDDTSITLQGKDGKAYCTSFVNVVLSEERITDFDK